MCILIGAFTISDNNKKYKEMNAYYDNTYQAFLNREYYSVISDTKNAISYTVKKIVVYKMNYTAIFL